MKQNLYSLLIVLSGLQIVKGLLFYFGVGKILFSVGEIETPFQLTISYGLLFSVTVLMLIHFYQKRCWFVMLALILSTAFGVYHQMEWWSFASGGYLDDPTGFLKRFEFIGNLRNLAAAILGVTCIIADYRNRSYLFMYGIAVLSLSLLSWLMGTLASYPGWLFEIVSLAGQLAPLILLIYFWKEMKKLKAEPTLQ